MLFAAAALALIDIPGYDAEMILRKSMRIAGDACVYTNHNLIIESVDMPAIAAVKIPAVADSVDTGAATATKA